MYMLEPADELGVKDDKGIFGVECPLWTEHVADEETLFKRFYPRALAVAETGWSAPGKDYRDFEDRLKGVLYLLDRRGTVYTPVDECNPGKIKAALQTAAFGMKMQRGCDPTSARNWRSMSLKQPKL